MNALATLPDRSLFVLVSATNLPGPNPARKLAPKFWEWFGDCIAAEVARRHEMQDVPEPTFPSLETLELENGALALLAMAGHVGVEVADEDTALAGSLREIAAGLLDVLRDRVVAARPGN